VAADRADDDGIDPLAESQAAEFDNRWPSTPWSTAPSSASTGWSTAPPDGWRDPFSDADTKRDLAATSARALAALHPGRRGVRALAIVAVVVVLVSAFVAWRARPHAVPLGAGASPTASEVTGAPSDPPAPTVGSPVATVLIVAVEGKVAHPGLVRLPSGSRVADAIAAAGGALPGADLSFVNIAQKVVDGELIVVGVPPPPGAAGSGAAGTSGTSTGQSAPINLNTASVADLDTLPGIGPALAQRIIDYRTQHGSFHSVDELRNVSGIGDAKFAEIKDLVTV